MIESHSPTLSPSNEPTGAPSTQPSEAPSADPSNIPSLEPSHKPSYEPTTSPSAEPTDSPSTEPTGFPSSDSPTKIPIDISSTVPNIHAINVSVNITPGWNDTGVSVNVDSEVVNITNAGFQFGGYPNAVLTNWYELIELYILCVNMVHIDIRDECELCDNAKGNPLRFGSRGTWIY